MAAETAVFKFLDLPRELRDLIYSHALSYSSIQNAFLAVNKASPSSASTPAHEIHRLRSLKRTPALLLTNRQVSSEALATLQRQELLLSTPLTGADIFFGWGGPTGTGIAFADLLPERQLVRIGRIRFRFMVWEGSYVWWLREHDAEYRAYAWCFPDGQELEHAPQGSLKDEKGEGVLVYGKAWGKLWLHVIDVLMHADGTLPRRRLIFEMERRSASRELSGLGEEVLRPTSEVMRYDLSLETEKLLGLKTAIWTSWQRGQYDSLLRFLEGPT